MRYLSNLLSFISSLSKIEFNPWLRAIFFLVSGSVIFFWIEPDAGLATLLLSITALSFSFLITRVEMRNSSLHIASFENGLRREFSIQFSSQIEAQIYNYAKKNEDELKEIDKALQSAEKNSLFYSGLAQGFIYLFMGSNILLNLYFSIVNFERGALSIIEFVVLTLFPFLIYSAIVALLSTIKK